MIKVCVMLSAPSDFTDERAIKKALKDIYATAVVRADSSPFDFAVRNVVSDLGLCDIIIQPNWAVYGGSAGVYRNSEVFSNVRIDRVMLFGDCEMNTRMINEAQFAGVPWVQL